MSNKSKMSTDSSKPKLNYYVGKAKKKIKDLYNKLKENLDEPMFKSGLKVVQKWFACVWLVQIWFKFCSKVV